MLTMPASLERIEDQKRKAQHIPARRKRGSNRRPRAQACVAPSPSPQPLAAVRMGLEHKVRHGVISPGNRKRKGRDDRGRRGERAYILFLRGGGLARVPLMKFSGEFGKRTGRSADQG